MFLSFCIYGSHHLICLWKTAFRKRKKQECCTENYHNDDGWIKLSQFQYLTYDQDMCISDHLTNPNHLDALFDSIELAQLYAKTSWVPQSQAKPCKPVLSAPELQRGKGRVGKQGSTNRNAAFSSQLLWLAGGLQCCRRCWPTLQRVRVGPSWYQMIVWKARKEALSFNLSSYWSNGRQLWIKVETKSALCRHW